MAKSIKEKITVDEFLNEDPDKQRDKDLILKLRRVTKPIYSEMEEIFYLYKKYINKDAQSYCATCNSGPSNSIHRYYWAITKLDLNNLNPL